MTDPEAADALASQGMHGVAYWEVMNWRNSDWKTAGISELVGHLGTMRQEGLPSIGISPHAPYTLETAPFVDLPDIARQLDMRLHIHLAETPMEAGADTDDLTIYSAAAWRDRHWTSYTELKREGLNASAIQFLDQLGSLGPDVHIAHGVWASAEDRRILRQRGVGVALCPRSNRITVTGKDAPVRAYLEEGNLLAIGTDSLSSSPSLDVLDDAALLYDLARAQGYRANDLSHRIIRMLTIGGAQEMGMHGGRRPHRPGQRRRHRRPGVLRHPRRHRLPGRHRNHHRNPGPARWPAPTGPPSSPVASSTTTAPSTRPTTRRPTHAPDIMPARPPPTAQKDIPMSVSLTDMSSYARSVVEQLGLEPHPEGGWYVRDWQSPINDRSGRRPLSSLIYFLLAEGDASAWHKVDADEIWLWHGPAPVTIEMAGSGKAPGRDRRPHRRARHRHRRVRGRRRRTRRPSWSSPRASGSAPCRVPATRSSPAWSAPVSNSPGSPCSSRRHRADNRLSAKPMTGRFPLAKRRPSIRKDAGIANHIEFTTISSSGE